MSNASKPAQSYPPILVCARIRKIFLPNAPPSRLTLFETLRPDGSGVFSGVVPLKKHDLFACPTVLVLRTIPSRDHQLAFILNEYREDFGDVEVARLVLPLVWFPPGKVVSYAYPMITRHPQDPAPMMAVDVHLAAGPPFAGPVGELRVVPTWEIPSFMLPEGQEIPPQKPPTTAKHLAVSSLLPEELLAGPDERQ
jgi:hypothetical protein